MFYICDQWTFFFSKELKDEKEGPSEDGVGGYNDDSSNDDDGYDYNDGDHDCGEERVDEAVNVGNGDGEGVILMIMVTVMKNDSDDGGSDGSGSDDDGSDAVDSDGNGSNDVGGDDGSDSDERWLVVVDDGDVTRVDKDGSDDERQRSKYR